MLYLLADLFNRTPFRLLWEASSHAAIHVGRLFIHTYIARYSFIQLSKLEQCLFTYCLSRLGTFRAAKNSSTLVYPLPISRRCALPPSYLFPLFCMLLRTASLSCAFSGSAHCNSGLDTSCSLIRQHSDLYRRMVSKQLLYILNCGRMLFCADFHTAFILMKNISGLIQFALNVRACTIVLAND